MRGILVIGFLLVAGLGGCLDDTGGGSKGGLRRAGANADAPLAGFDPLWFELALTTGEDHNHADHSKHLNQSTPNFNVLGYEPLITDYHGRTAGGYLCGDANERNGRRLSVVHSFTTDIAFIVSDVTDPAKPQKIGEFVMANTHVYDLAITQDQRTVLLATSPGTNNLGPDPGPIVATFRDACTGETRPVAGPEQGLPFASGIVVVDISNPRNPAIADFRFFPVNGGHSVMTRDIGNRPVVLVSVPNGGLPTVGNPLGVTAHSYYAIAELVETAQGRKMNVLSVYQHRVQPSPAPGVAVSGNVHDGTLHRHPVTNQWLAYLAHGTSGLVILNVDDPRSPQLVGYWNDWAKLGAAAQNTHFQHETLPIDGTWDGKHYTFMGEECSAHPAKTPTCLVTAFDTTDPKKPTLVGAWTLPVDVAWGGSLMYSLHYMAVVNRTLFVTVYHGGLWAVDVGRLSADAPVSLPSVGVFMPPNQSPKPATGVPYSPRVNDLQTFADGTMVVYDAYTGLYLVRFDESLPAPAPEPWAFG
ncbi:MAG: hypothetical protein HYT80_10530 [Euryarchaeota archaeon]|nr:hypothetical protein [Euryarchaeota archaeon]